MGGSTKQASSEQQAASGTGRGSRLLLHNVRAAGPGRCGHHGGRQRGPLLRRACVREIGQTRVLTAKESTLWPNTPTFLDGRYSPKFRATDGMFQRPGNPRLGDSSRLY